MTSNQRQMAIDIFLEKLAEKMLGGHKPFFECPKEEIENEIKKIAERHANELYSVIYEKMLKS